MTATSPRQRRARAARRQQTLRHRHGGQVTAADDVTFTIEAGAFVALTGASGSGKSTLLHMIGALERPDSGTIISNGTDVTALRGAALADYRRTVGFVFQRYNLLPGLTALDNVHRTRPALPHPLGQTPAGQGAAGSRRPGRARTLTARTDVRRRTAAHRHRPRPDQHPARCCSPTSPPATSTPPTPPTSSTCSTRLRAEHHMTIMLASHDPQIAARAERLIRLRDGAVIDDIQLTQDRPVEDIIRHISQLG